MKYNTPLFIVGVGRSGTKLIRTLLNNHSQISLPSTESQFIPDFIKKWPAHQQQDFTLFLQYLKGTHFYKRVSSTSVFDEKVILNEKARGFPADFIELVLKYTSKKFQGFDHFSYIWGDKTPGYIWHVDTLKELYPNAMFIHIIRDPRDVALSYKNTWGKSLRGTTEKWRSTMEQLEQRGLIGQSWLLEIHYEDLITNPEEVLRQVTQFLDISYEWAMNNLNNPVERFGDARQKRIEKNNTKKYRSNLSVNQIKKIESIVLPYLLQKGYQSEYKDIEYKPLNRFEILFYRIIDSLSFLWHHLTKEEGRNGVAVILKTQFKKLISLI